MAKVLASQCWGTVEEKEGNSVWKLAHNTISFTKPDPELVSYAKFASGMYPSKTTEEEPDENRRALVNKEIAGSYAKLISEFVSPGKPGYKFKSVLDKMLRCLSLPKSICEYYSLSGAGEEEKEENPEEEEQRLIKQLFSGGKALLVPSFFRLIQELKKNKREYSIVFRTFGMDAEVIREEFNLFCRGSHPMFNGKHGTPRLRYDGKNNTKNMCIEPTNVGYISRVDLALVLGTLNRHPEGTDPSEFHSKAVDEGLVAVHSDYSSIYVAMQEVLLSSASMLIVDDYNFWNSHGETGESGKLLLVDDTDYSTLQVFFDDKIGHEAAGIVDIRDVVTGESIPHAAALNKFYFKVDSYRAVTEPDYFYKSLLLCEENRTQEIYKREIGGEEESFHHEGQETEWEELQQTNTSEYLSKVIFPVLLPGLKAVDMARPDDAVSFLTLYILKHQALVKLPTVSYSS